MDALSFSTPLFYFNPRTLQESATGLKHGIKLQRGYFNPRTLQESATSGLLTVFPRLYYFNPRTLQESATSDY